MKCLCTIHNSTPLYSTLICTVLHYSTLHYCTLRNAYLYSHLSCVTSHVSPLGHYQLAILTLISGDMSDSPMGTDKEPIDDEKEVEKEGRVG